jgi:hypothetical protein
MISKSNTTHQTPYIGYTEPEIEGFLCRYFGPAVREERVQKVAPVPESETDGGLERQQRVIEALAMQLHSLRSGIEHSLIMKQWLRMTDGN